MSEERAATLSLSSLFVAVARQARRLPFSQFSSTCVPFPDPGPPRTKTTVRRLVGVPVLTPARERSIGAAVVVSADAPGAQEDEAGARPRLATAAALARPRPKPTERRREEAATPEEEAAVVAVWSAAVAVAQLALLLLLLVEARRVERMAPKRAVAPRRDAAMV